MIPAAFDYHAPASVSEAVGLLARLGEDAKVLAGGHSLLPMMKLRFAQPAALVDLKRIDALRGIGEEGGLVRIGAMTTERQLIESPLLRDKLPLLAEAARQIADPQVRNRGTIGGDIAHGDPANDHPAIALALDAVFVLAGPGGERRVAAADFFLGPYLTAMQADEILVAILAAPFAPGAGHAYCKLKRKTGDWATAAAAVVLRLDGGRVAEVRIGLTNVAPTALRAGAVERFLAGRGLDAATLAQAAEQVRGLVSPAEDLRGDEEYKAAMAGEMTCRALLQAAARCA